MKIDSKLIFLGTGGSMGVPVVGCSCSVCSSTSHYNKRKRPSALCKIGNQHLLIDCGPDFREQALKHEINQLDGVIFTHAHNDHTVGVDDLKPYCLRTGRPIPCLLSPETAAELKQRFAYMFSEKQVYAGMMTRFAIQLLESKRGEVVFQGVRIRYFSYEQLNMDVNGYRFGDLAYVSDIKNYSADVISDLEGVRTLILSSLRFETSKMHFNIDDAIAFSEKVGAEKTWLMHLSHEMDYTTGNAYLPKNIRLAYDGLQIDFQAEVIDNNDI